MARRKIIEIDEDLCNGCGVCITACAEGALRLVNGKAKLVKEDFCDGFGDCLGECPTGALQIVEREAPGYDPAATRAHLAHTAGAEAVRHFDEAAARHEAAHGSAMPAPPASGGGCPGMRMRTAAAEAAADRPPAAPVAGDGLPPQVNASELKQWPIQLHLVPPGAPFFKGRELVVMNTCGPLASADVHWRFLRGRAVVVACPKLDRTEPYVEKLAAILREPTIPRMLVVRMEVPCCGGLTRIALEAAARSSRADLRVEEAMLSLDGAVRNTVTVVDGKEPEFR
jgi:NAD-dependent dihydropyrimidine dehydrogenase PreA subunit